MCTLKLLFSVMKEMTDPGVGGVVKSDTNLPIMHCAATSSDPFLCWARLILL